MAKGLKILFFILSLGVMIFPQQISFAQEVNIHEISCCSSDEENDTPKGCCETSCQDCIFSHCHHFSFIFYYKNDEEMLSDTFFIQANKISQYLFIILKKGSHNIWQPPKIG